MLVIPSSASRVSETVAFSTSGDTDCIQVLETENSALDLHAAALLCFNSSTPFPLWLIIARESISHDHGDRCLVDKQVDRLPGLLYPDT